MFESYSVYTGIKSGLSARSDNTPNHEDILKSQYSYLFYKKSTYVVIDHNFLVYQISKYNSFVKILRKKISRKIFQREQH